MTETRTRSYSGETERERTVDDRTIDRETSDSEATRAGERTTTCPECGKALRKVFSAIGVTFQGSGFYRTDSRADAKKSASKASTTKKESGSSASSGSTSAAPAKKESSSSSSTSTAGS